MESTGAPSRHSVRAVTLLVALLAGAGTGTGLNLPGSADAGVPGIPDSGLTAPDGGRPPRGLSCLPQWYAGEVAYRPDAGWGLALTGGAFIPWAGPPAAGDGDTEVIAHLSELFRVPYPMGPIVPLDASDAGPIEDPGRARIEQLFAATYGSTRAEVAGRLTKVRLAGTRYPFHERAAPALARVNERLTAALAELPSLRAFVTRIGGTWAWRRISRSKNLSSHAFGIAIDLNVDRAHYWRWQRRGEPLRWQNRFPQAVVDAFEAEGFIWGGRWLHYDTMHFEYRPELLSPECRERRGP